MMFSNAFLVVALEALLAISSEAVLSGPDDLGKQYYNIFKSGNRNAASHLWASYVLNQASSMPAANVKNVFKGFCPVSGSPLPDQPRTRYKVSLRNVGGDLVTGVSHHCCWPCICDEVDFLRVDTKTVVTSDGPQVYNMLVLGDPCKYPDKLKVSFTDPFTQATTSLHEDAPELACTANNTLVGATYSDHGYPIVGLFFTDAADMNDVPAPPVPMQPNDPTFGYGDMCHQRKQNGYNSGMGLIFHLVAKINPIPTTPTMQKYDMSIDLSQKSLLQAGAMQQSKESKLRSLATIGWTSLAILCVVSMVYMAHKFRDRLDAGMGFGQSSPIPFELSNFEVLE